MFSKLFINQSISVVFHLACVVKDVISNEESKASFLKSHKHKNVTFPVCQWDLNVIRLSVSLSRLQLVSLTKHKYVK